MFGTRGQSRTTITSSSTSRKSATTNFHFSTVIDRRTPSSPRWIVGRMVTTRVNMMMFLLLGTIFWMTLPGVDGKILHYDKRILPPGTAFAEIHPIQGSGGLISLNAASLFQRVGVVVDNNGDDNTNPAVVEMILVQVPSSCHLSAHEDITTAQANQECQWTETAGVGISTGSATEFCCTQALADANQCHSVGLSIIDEYNFRGAKQMVNLNHGGGGATGGLAAEQVKFDVTDTGDYALIILNCNTQSSIQMNGEIAWESYPGGFEVWEMAQLELAGDLEQMAQTCDLDVDFFLDGPAGYGNDNTAYIKVLEEYVADLAVSCTDTEITQMNSALDDFATCAGFDLQQFMEDLPSAFLGTVIECLVTMDWEQFEDLDMLDLNEISSIQLSDACLDFEFGDNAVGYGLRHFALFPDKTLACLKAFAPKVPPCTLQTYPVPIVGGWLKPAACMMGEMATLLDDVLRVEMGIWDQCLPADPKAVDCDVECLYQGSILMRGGNMALPVSDTMTRLAAADTNGNLQSALDRYQLYLDECTHEWSGWKDFDPTTQTAKRHSNDGDSDSANGGDDSGSSNSSNSSDKQVTPSSNMEKEDSEGSGGVSPILMLVLGMVLGISLTVLYERSQRRRGGGYRQTTMEKQLELTEGGSGAYTDRDNEIL